MRKLLIVLCIAILAVSYVTACKGPGLPCMEDSDCCGPLMCNPWAGRCIMKPAGPGWGPEPGNPDVPPADDQQ